MFKMARNVSLALIAGILSSTAVLASSSNVPEFYLNVRGTVSCTACHSGAAANTGGGAVRIEGLPEQYVPGQKYTVRVVISHAGFKKWGFLLSSTDAGGRQAGQFITDDPAIDVKVSGGVTFVKQSFNGTDSFGASRSWSVVWKAPASGRADFAAQAVAADGSGSVRGDFAYHAKTSLAPAATAAD